VRTGGNDPLGNGVRIRLNPTVELASERLFFIINTKIQKVFYLPKIGITMMYPIFILMIYYHLIKPAATAEGVNLYPVPAEFTADIGYFGRFILISVTVNITPFDINFLPT